MVIRADLEAIEYEDNPATVNSGERRKFWRKIKKPHTAQAVGADTTLPEARGKERKIQ